MVKHASSVCEYLVACVCLVGVLAIDTSCSKRDTGTEAASGTNAVGRGSDNTSGKTIQEMAPDDVIVSVDGAVLTKRLFEQNIKRMLTRLVQRPNLQRGQITAMGRRYIQTYIPSYVNTQILMQEARRQGTLSEADLAAAVDAWIKHEAKSERKTADEFVKTVPGGAAALTNDAIQILLVEAVIATNVLSKVSVPDTVVQDTIAAIKAENEAISATNAVKVAWLKTLREQIAAGADFGKLADIHSQCQRSAPGCSGYWGEFGRREFTEPKMRDAIFQLKAGEISDVLENDEGFHLVKLLAYTGAQTNVTGKAVQAETASLAHILIRSEPALEMSVPADLKKQLFEQFKQRRTAEYLEGLREKAVISYPNGTNFWPKAGTPPPKARAAQAK
jgi:hypothetical protein